MLDFSHPRASQYCDGCGEYLSACRCEWDDALLQEGPLWIADQDVSDLPDGFHIWDSDRPRLLGAARWNDLPGIIHDIIADADLNPECDNDAELIDWLAAIGYPLESACGDDDLGPTLGDDGTQQRIRTCSCTGLSHEHDRHACPPEPVPAED